MNSSETDSVSPITATNTPPRGIALREITPIMEDSLPIISGAVVFMIILCMGAFTTGNEKPNINVITLIKIKLYT